MAPSRGGPVAPVPLDVNRDSGVEEPRGDQIGGGENGRGVIEERHRKGGHVNLRAVIEPQARQKAPVQFDDDMVILDYDDREEEEQWHMKSKERPQKLVKEGGMRERPEWLGRPFTVESTVKQTKSWLHHGSHGKIKESWSL